MKPDIKTLIIVVIGLVVISTAIVYVIFNNDFFKTIEEEIDLQPGILSRQDLVLKNEVRDEIKKFEMIKRIKKRDLILNKENFTQISNYQKYVTPDTKTISDYIQSQGIGSYQDAYKTAVNWTWVSDQKLHGISEKWLYPHQFITTTPNMPSNPIFGYMVSDCESQAYTLVSIIETLGFSKQNIRIVVGEVNFSGEIGGHAWIQVYEDDEWFEIEATSGPYWDEDNNKHVESNGFPYMYFKTHPYPVEEYWAFFNDKYYYNPDSGQKSSDLPSHWLMETGNLIPAKIMDMPVRIKK